MTATVDARGAWKILLKLDMICIKVELAAIYRPQNGTKVKEERYFISIAAEMLGMHPQTLRKYERLGLIQPSRTIGSMRRYSREELDRLRLIKHLVDEVGINLAGVQRLLLVVEVMERIRPLMDDDALNTGAGRRQLLREIDSLSKAIGL